MSVCEAMPNGDKLSELLKLYLMSYIVGMVARYYPAQWLAVIPRNVLFAGHRDVR